jgi:hypothetical protein
LTGLNICTWPSNWRLKRACVRLRRQGSVLLSRAYYAAFHKAKEITLPQDASGGFDSHRQIVDTLQESDDAVRRQIGVDLDRLRGNRIHADYRNQPKNWSALVEDTLIESEDVIARLGALQS